MILQKEILVCAIAMAASFCFADDLNWKKLPSRLVGGDWIVQGKIGESEPAWFIVDTGSPITAIERADVEKFKLTHRSTAADGMLMPFDVIIDDVKIHTEDAKSWPVHAARPPDETTQISGILGWDMLSRFVVRFDPIRKQISIINPEEFVPPLASDEIYLKVQDRLPFVSVQCQDKHQLFTKMDVLIDSGFREAMRGADGVISMGRAYVDSFGYTNPTSLRSMLLGKSKIADIPMAPLGSQPEGSPVSALIGQAILLRYVLVFDYKSNRLFVAPAVDESKPVVPKLGCDLLIGAEAKVPSSGSLVYKGPRWRVVGVDSGSLAEICGLRNGDNIEFINGIAVQRINISELPGILSTPAPEGITFSVRSDDGERRRVVVQAWPEFATVPPAR